MGYQQCVDTITRAVGRNLSDDELEDIDRELQRRIKEKQRLNEVDDLDVAVREAADDYAKDMASAAKIERRNAAINLRTRLQAVDFIETQFAGRQELGLEALMVGVNTARKGSRRSAAAAQASLKRKYFAGLIWDIESQGNWQIFLDGSLDREIARAMWALNRKDPQMPDVPRPAIDIARSISKWQEIARTDANKAGAWIKKIEGYIVRQSHDMHKIRNAGYQQWKADIIDRLDDRTFIGVDDAEKFLEQTWQALASGVHLKSGAEGKPSGFKGPRNIAKRASAERVLHFKSSDDWFDYNAKYGFGTLSQSVILGLDYNAQTTGLMRRLGTNPESNFDEIAKTLMSREKDPARRQLISEFAGGRARHFLHELDGTTRNPVNAMPARVFSNIRVFQRMTKLGASLLSQFGDIPLYASEMRYQGRSMLGGVAEAIGNLFKNRGSREQRELGALLGVYSDTMSGEVAGGRFSLADDDISGAMSKAQQLFFKMNGMAWWTDANRRGAIMSMAHHLSWHKGKKWQSLNPDMKRSLELYGIGEGEWNIIRASSSKLADGREYVVPEAIMDVDDARFEETLRAQGVKPTAARVRNMKEEIADKIRDFYTDRSSYAVIEPDARTRAIMQRGTRRGTVPGELLRFIGELKAFPVSVIQKSLGREVYGRGAAPGASLMQALRNGNGEMRGMANLFLWTTIFGYISMSAKDLAKGREPRPPDNKKTWLAAAVQGGGLGIYGDFLFGEANRYGGGVVSTLAGPTLGGTTEDVYDLYIRARDGDDLAAQSFRTLLNNTPFANLFYTRIALDYLILYEIQEALNPGSLRRMERRIERENEQQFYLRPSQYAR